MTRKKKPKLKIQSGITSAVQPLALPSWLTGARRCELYQLIAGECSRAGMSLKAAHACGLTGFAMALEFAELLVRHGKKSHLLSPVGDDVIEWGEAFGLDDETVNRLLTAVGVRRSVVAR